MPAPDTNSVLKTLREAADFAQRVGLPKEAAKFEELHCRFQTEKPTLKALRSDGESARLELSYKMRRIFLDDQDRLRVGMETVREEYYRISNAIERLEYPPEPRVPEVDISSFAGAENVEEKAVRYFGEMTAARPIVERSIEFVRRYSSLVGSGDFPSAYALTDAGLRAWMSYQRFVGEHKKAEELYGGPCLEFRIGCFVYVLTDENSRIKSNKADERWPKATAKESRRSAVNGFWIRDRAAQTGCGGTLWIAEENKEYRIAKFDFWRP